MPNEQFLLIPDIGRKTGPPYTMKRSDRFIFRNLLRSELQQPEIVKMLSITGIFSLFRRNCVLFSIIASI